MFTIDPPPCLTIIGTTQRDVYIGPKRVDGQHPFPGFIGHFANTLTVIVNSSFVAQDVDPAVGVMRCVYKPLCVAPNSYVSLHAKHFLAFCSYRVDGLS